jgi:hypothetical protein
LSGSKKHSVLNRKKLDGIVCLERYGRSEYTGLILINDSRSPSQHWLANASATFGTIREGGKNLDPITGNVDFKSTSLSSDAEIRKTLLTWHLWLIEQLDTASPMVSTRRNIQSNRKTLSHFPSSSQTFFT